MANIWKFEDPLLKTCEMNVMVKSSKTEGMSDEGMRVRV